MHSHEYDDSNEWSMEYIMMNTIFSNTICEFASNVVFHTYNPGQGIWNKANKYSKIGQG